MQKYKFEIQACIGVVVEAENPEEARLNIVDNINDYADEMVKDCYVSDGVLLNECMHGAHRK